MLQPLAGRLTWEHTATGIHVEIPARRGWWLLFLFVWLVLWLGLGGMLVARMIASDEFSLFNTIWSAGWLIATIFGISVISWSLTGQTSLFLDQSEMRIRRQVLGVEWDTRTFRTQFITNLRFIPGQWTRDRWNDNSYTQSEIRFDAEDKTRSFASGLEDAEAFALIDRMLEVHNFPKDRAVDYIARA